MTFSTCLADLFRRDLSRLIDQVEAFPDDQMLWATFPGTTNSAGNLTLHLEGNLREYVGRQLGGVAYTRKRPLEFSLSGIRGEELRVRLEELREMIPAIVARLSTEELEMEYPEVVLGVPVPTQQFLVHLYGHLNWHLGQIDYLRRGLSGEGTIRAATL